MADKDKNPGIFNKLLDAGSAMLDAQIYKAKTALRSEAEADFNFGKALTRDRHQYIGAQGFEEKPGAIGYEFQKHMAVRSSIIAAIIRTRQNRVAAYSDVAKDPGDLGFRIVLKNEEAALEKLKEELLSGKADNAQSAEQKSSEDASDMRKADEGFDEEATLDPSQLEGSEFDEEPAENDYEAMSDRELNRILKEMLDEQTKEKRQQIADFVRNCGELKDRPFETKKWNFDSFLKALVFDTLVYDQMAIEKVPKNAETNKEGRMNIHHFYPIDASTVRYASPELRKMNGSQNATMTNYNILYPEEEMNNERLADLELNDELLEQNAYKYVQVVKGRIERAFTEKEMGFGIRNLVTDIYMNGYGLSELEVLVGLVSSHLQTEFYNKSYFQQGFSAKGILHIKANLNRSKLEELRRHWKHMVSGNRQSFQTPIMSGMEEIQWIPLTQNHSEMEFNLWLTYLIKMICAIYQIDPAEIGYAIKDEGKGGISGDNTEEKMENSKDKGLVPLMRYIAEFMTKNVVDEIDPDYKFEWCGLMQKSEGETIQNESLEVKYKKTVNEIREENGLPPIPGADDLILDPVYFQWFSMFHPDGKAQQEQAQQQEQEAMMGEDQAGAEEAPPEENPEQDYHVEEAQKEADHERQMEIMDKQHEQSKEMASHSAKVAPKSDKKEVKKSERVKKSLRIETYILE